MANVYIGVDNGVTGAMVAISGHNGSIVAMCPMPIMRARKGNEIDIKAVYVWFQSVAHNLSEVTFVIEEPGGSKSAKAASSMAGSFHAMRAIFDLKGLRWHRITPQEWQKSMLPGAKGDTKPRALAKARQLWPEESFLASDRCKVAHNGLIDSALIAEYARIKNL